MDLFFQLFHFDIQIIVLAPVLIFALVGSVIVYFMARKETWRKMLYVWLVSVLLLMLYVAVLKRTVQDSYSWQLVPFWSYSQIRDGYIETLYENIFNVLFFIPYGFLLGAFFKRNGFLLTIVFGVLASVIIELTQLITRTGVCETDDVIHNTLGCVIGFLLFRLLRLFFRLLFY